MIADVVQTIKVRAGDLECSVCTERFGRENRLPMSLLCGHTFCSCCLTQIKKCPTCREKIEQKPQKNTTICSIIETHSSTSSKKACSLHLQPCNVLCPKTNEFVCTECFFENNTKIPTLNSINAKVQKMKEKGDEINRKRQSAIDSLEELLLQDKNDAEQTISDAYDEELARVLSLRKKRKRDVDTFYYSKKEGFQHELLAADLVKYLDENKRKLDEWKDHQKAKAATEIMETDLEAGKEMEDFDKKVNELKTAIQTRQKNFDQGDSKDLRQYPFSKHRGKAEYNYLYQTFKEYGINATYEGSQESQEIEFRTLSLQASSSEPVLQRFYPKYFDCTISELELNCLNNEKFNFGIVCDILGNVNSLSVLGLSFTEPPLSEFELLSDFMLEKKNPIEILHLDFPLTKASISSALKLLTTLLSLNRMDRIIVQSFDGRLICSMPFNNIPCSLKSCKVITYSESRNCSTILRESFEAFSEWLKSISLEEFGFDFSTDEQDPSRLQHFSCFLESLPNLLKLNLRMESPSLLRNNLLNLLIFERIVKHSRLKALELFIPGDPEETHPGIDELFGQFENTEYSNQSLEELDLTFYDFKKINLQKVLFFISCFCKLKALKLRFYLVKKDLVVIYEFFKRIHELKCLEKFTFEFFTPKGLTSNQLQELKALLPTSLTESTIVIEKLSSETASQCYVWLREDKVRHDEDDE